jgi:hypothetical protein
MTLKVGPYPVTIDKAKLLVAGFAFGTRPVAPKPKLFPQQPFQPVQLPRWGYQTYDCVPASESEEFSDIDLFVAAGLNGRLDVAAITALPNATSRAGPHFWNAAHFGVNLADLSSAELADSPPSNSVGAELIAAWQQMTATPEIGIALTHKVLHQKRPHLFPLLDRKTARSLSCLDKEGNLWQKVHADLNDSRQEFEDLARWFDEIATDRGCVSLSLPRLHDILLWLHVEDEAEVALSAGEQSLGAPPRGPAPA